MYQRTDPRGITSTYAYDALNRLHTITYTDSTPTVTYNYGTAPASFNNGRITSYSDGTGSTTFTYNALGRIIKTGKAMGQVNYNIQYLYNPAGEVTRLTYPSGRAVNQTYDTIGRLQTIADATNNYLTVTPLTDYNSAGQLKHFAYGNGVVADFGYNDHFETTSIRYSKTGSADLLNLTYGYGTQNNGEIATITDNLVSANSTSYTYDAWSRLSTAQAGPNTSPTWKYSYDYDRFGNRKNQNLLAGTTGYNTQLTIDPGTNHITGTGNTYDAAGNMTGDGTHTYTFDAENRITKIDTTTATYSYDGTNLRAKKVVGTTTILYIYNGSSLIAEYAGGAAASSPTKEYIGGGALASVSAGVVTYNQPDMLSARVQTNGAGAVTRTYGHLPFGEDWYETGTADKWKFTTYERDTESQLNYAMNRLDSGRYGRFMSTDPLGGSVGVPQSLNRYAYAGDDPVNYVDPSGLLMEPTCRTGMEVGCGGGGGAGGSGVYVDGVELPNFSSLGGALVASGAGVDITTVVTTTTTSYATPWVEFGNGSSCADFTCSTGTTVFTLPTVEVSYTDVSYLPSLSTGGGSDGGNGSSGGGDRGAKAWTPARRPTRPDCLTVNAEAAVDALDVFDLLHLGGADEIAKGAGVYMAERHIINSGLVVPLRSSIVRSYLAYGEVAAESITLLPLLYGETVGLYSQIGSQVKGTCKTVFESH